MPDLSLRSTQKELLDRDDIPFSDIRRNMQELNTINRLLGGHGITIRGVQALLPAKKTPQLICEIGCGGGDNLQAIHRWASRQQYPIRFLGVDIKPECIAFAKEQYPGLPTGWMCNDYQQTNFSTTPDIIFSSLFCHHFTEDELIDMMRWMQAHSRRGFFINDLQRHPLPYYSIKWLTRIFSRSYLVKNDAPLSVARGFTKKDWQRIFLKAGIGQYSIQWKWAFRHLIVCKK